MPRAVLGYSACVLPEAFPVQENPVTADTALSCGSGSLMCPGSLIQNKRCVVIYQDPMSSDVFVCKRDCLERVSPQKRNTQKGSRKQCVLFRELCLPLPPAQMNGDFVPQ